MKKLKQLSLKDKILYFLSFVLVVAFVAYWQIGADNNWFNSVLLSSPQKVLDSFLTLLKTGSLQRHIVISFKRVMIGYAFGAGSGILLGFLLSALPPLKKLSSFALGLIRPIPSMALFPLFILWFGIGETSKIVVIAFVAFWPTFLNTEEGVLQTDKKLIELADVLQKNTFKKITTIILPSTVPYIFAGLRLSISRAWGGVVVAEMLAASAGIGFLIEYSRNMSQTASMFVGVITIALIGFVIDLIITILHDKVCYWNTEV